MMIGHPRRPAQWHKIYNIMMVYITRHNVYNKMAVYNRIYNTMVVYT